MAFENFKLGKHPKREDARTLKLKAYLPSQLPAAPAKIDFSEKVANGSWGMMLNDNLGDCTIAAAGHLIEQWTANAGNEYSPEDSDILAAYEAVGGYNPNDPSTDNGCVELDVLNYWRNTGIAGHKIGAYASVEHEDDAEVEAAAYIFGGLYIGVQLPLSAQTQGIWDVVNGPNGVPGSWGGHAVEICAYDQNYLTCVTWGQLVKMTWAFWATYVDEAYAILSQDFIEGNGDTPEGFDLDQLTTDLNAIGG